MTDPARDLSGTLQGAGGIGGLLASFISTNSLQSTVCFTSFDANGNVTDLVSTNGSSLAHYEYGPYGDVVAQSGLLADENSIRFSTKYWDAETRMGWWGYRYYHPDVGRWLSRDPLEEGMGANLFLMVNNQPVNLVDWLGLATPEQIIAFDDLLTQLESSPCECAQEWAKRVRKQFTGWQKKNAPDIVKIEETLKNLKKALKAYTAGANGTISFGQWIQKTAAGEIPVPLDMPVSLNDFKHFNALIGYSGQIAGVLGSGNIVSATLLVGQMVANAGGIPGVGQFLSTYATAYDAAKTAIEHFSFKPETLQKMQAAILFEDTDCGQTEVTLNVTPIMF
jgi:RHS repeat-associated protein